MINRDVIPDLAAARRAAAAVADAGAGQVVLFGSVARGQATRNSDIDLIAIYDDVDYSQRRGLARELTRLAEAASGHRVDVMVTDQPEWKVRTEEVHASLECTVAREGIILVARPLNRVDWNKQILIPVTDYQEAIALLGWAAVDLKCLPLHLRPGHAESQSSGELAHDLQQIRLERVLQDAYTAIGASIRALIHLVADPCLRSTVGCRSLVGLCSQLPEPHRRVLSRMVEPLSTRAGHLYRVTKKGEDHDERIPPEFAALLVRTACRVAAYAATQFPATERTVRTLSRGAEQLDDALDQHCPAQHSQGRGLMSADQLNNARD